MTNAISSTALEPWIRKLSQQTDDTLANVTWQAFASSVPSVGLNAGSRLSQLKAWIEQDLPVIIRRAGDEGLEFKRSLDLLVYAAEREGADAIEKLDEAMQLASYHGTNAARNTKDHIVEAGRKVKQLALDGEHALDIHLVCVVSGFLLHNVFSHMAEVPLGDLAAFTILVIRMGAKVLSRI